jgi:hypothetical protein
LVELGFKHNRTAYREIFTAQSVYNKLLMENFITEKKEITMEIDM